MSLKTKKSNEPILRKSDFKFPTYLTMTRNLSKSLKKVCERGLGLTNDTNKFSSPYPFRKINVLTFLIGTVISMRKGKSGFPY